MTTTHSNPTLKKHYSTPELLVKGEIEALTQQNKEFGLGDSMFLVIPGVPNPIPIKNYS